MYIIYMRLLVSPVYVRMGQRDRDSGTGTAGQGQRDSGMSRYSTVPEINKSTILCALPVTCALCTVHRGLSFLVLVVVC